jgi:hypothetical protein
LTVVLATIATILVMMPGFAFIAGVNVTDKNIREIVFRGTPAEIAYVVAISLLVHMLANLTGLWGYNVSSILESFGEWQTNSMPLRNVITTTLTYTTVAALAGALFGFLVGTLVQRWRLPFLIKHRWMMDLLPGRDGAVIFARALTTPSYAVGRDAGDFAILIEGSVRDVYFASDGTLLHIVFTSFQERGIKLGMPMFDEPSAPGAVTTVAHLDPGRSDQLVLEGRHIAMVQYDRLPGGKITMDSALERIAAAERRTRH